MNLLSKNELARYKKLLQKKYRILNKEFIVEGYHLVEEAIKANVVKLIITSNENINLKSQNIKFTTFDDISKLSSTKNPQDVIAICAFLKSKKERNSVLVLNNINDPGNLGTLIRTACAFNFDDVIVQGVDIYNPKTLRASQGAIFKVNVFNVSDLEEYLLNLKRNQYQLIGSILDKNAKTCENIQIKEKNVLILGNEANGIDNNIIKMIDEKVYIPINFESLNVAVAGGILMEKIKNKTKISF